MDVCRFTSTTDKEPAFFSRQDRRRWRAFRLMVGNRLYLSVLVIAIGLLAALTRVVRSMLFDVKTHRSRYLCFGSGVLAAPRRNDFCGSQLFAPPDWTVNFAKMVGRDPLGRFPNASG